MSQPFQKDSAHWATRALRRSPEDLQNSPAVNLHFLGGFPMEYLMRKQDLGVNWKVMGKVETGRARWLF